jgi:hypothetical protein
MFNVRERGAVKRLPIFALLIGIFSLASCGGGSSTTSSTAIVCTTTTSSTNTTNGTTTTSSTSSSSSACSDPVTGISVAISPSIVSVNVATSQQFQAALSGGTNTKVTWQVNSITGGNDTFGLIDSNGLYHAPATVPTTAVTVTVVSFEDQNLSASSSVTILPPPTVTISPTSATLTAGTSSTLVFTGNVTGAPTTNVTWNVNNTLGGNSTFGTISATGVYTAPQTPPVGSTVTVTAVSSDFPLSTASATITISGYSQSSLQGQFAFSMSGKNASGPFFRAGSFAADGNGNLNGGLEDVNAGACGAASPISFAGTYTIATDGRGTLTFNDGCTPSTFSFVLVSNTQLQITGFDATGTASGQANLQDATFFNAAGLVGTYVFDFSGVHGSAALSQIGEFTADGLGNITGGLRDTNDGGTITPQASFAGSYQVNSNGRGTATFGSQHFSFYIVSRGAAKFVGTDSVTAVGAVAGLTTQQSPISSYDVTSLNGNIAFLLNGPVPNGSIATAGSFSADGNGDLVSGVLDENVNGAATINSAISGGTYAVSSTNGRGTATFTTSGHTYNLVFYLTTTGNAVVQETDSGRTSDGLLRQQQTAAFAMTSIQGNYEVQTTGLSSGSDQTIAGQVTSSGANAISTGALDINTAGTLTPGEAVKGTYSSPSAIGRSVLALNPSSDNRNFATYIIGPNQCIVVSIDNRLAAGTLVRRF